MKNGKYVKDFLYQSNPCVLVCDAGYRTHAAIPNECKKTKTYRLKLVKAPEKKYNLYGEFVTRYIYVITANGNKKLDPEVHPNTESNIKNQYKNSEFMSIESVGNQKYLGIGYDWATGIYEWYNKIVWSLDVVNPGDTLFTYVVPDGMDILGFEIPFNHRPAVRVTLDRGSGEKVVYDEPENYANANISDRMLFTDE